MLDSAIKGNKKYYPQRMQICTRKVKNIEPYDLEKSESDTDFNDETESDIDNDESDE